MRFGGHETFPVREGWLHKGLRLLKDSPELLSAEDLADHLGVGRNMGKSIRHWLQATQLASKSPESEGGKRALLQLTDLGELVWQKDPYFLSEGTWWILHVNLVNNPDYAASWSWFFNSFSHDRFDRSVCVESLQRHVEMTQKRHPSPTTLDRDLGCMLATYARTIPGSHDDPEDGNDCPFRDLNLLSYFRTSGYYQLHHEVKPIPPEVLGFSLASTFEDAASGARATDISITDAARKAGGPGRCFALTAESLFEVASRAESLAENNEIQISGLAGDRVIRVKQRSPLDWVAAHYATIEERELHAV
jgi:hypothetical protein